MMRNFRTLLTICFFLWSDVLLAQDEFTCLTTFADSLRSNCAYNSSEWSYYSNQNLYVPDGNSGIPFHNTPIKTVNVSINVIQKNDGSGNFQDTPDTRNRFRGIIDWINDFYSNYSPSDQINWVSELPNYDSKIRFSIGEEGEERIYFIKNTSWWYYYDAVYGLYIYNDTLFTNHPERMEDVNIFIFGNPYNYNYANSLPPSWNDFDSNTAIATFYWPSEDSDYAKAGTLAHELGHVLDLLHTYSGTGASPIDDPNNKDFLKDVFLVSLNPDVSNCPHIADYYLNAYAVNGDRITNNLMGGNKDQKYISPLQAGQMHRALSLTSSRKYVHCEKSNIPLVITNEQLWDFDIKLYRDLIVESNAKLTLTNHLVMNPDCRIIVKPGGKLIIDGAIIGVDMYEKEQWQGIEVWGNSSASQFAIHGHYGQGFLELKNGAVIENAKCAVELWRPGYYSTTGGIIHATDATFRNNAMAVRVMHYTNYHPYSHLHLNYDANFDNCNFAVDNNYLGTYDFEKHVDLAEVNGISFRKCVFSADRSVSGVYSGCMGISANDAGFAVTSYCLTNVQPCPEADMGHSTFTGLCKGICVFGAGNNPHAFMVRDAIFNNNDYGIHVENSSYPTILFNEFKIGGGGYCDYNYGVCIEISTGFCIEENYFHPTPSTQSTTIGVAIYSSNGINDVYRNTFEGLQQATLAYGQNTNGSTGALQGLTYTCNEFIGNQWDIMVLKRNGIGDIQSQQGSLTTPAGNTFANSTFQIYNDGINPMDYYYNSTESDETPNTTMLYRVTRHGTTSANSCVSHYGNTPIVKSPSEKAALASDYFSAYNAYMNLRQLYESHIDDSDTENPTADNSPTSAELLQLSTQMAQYGHAFTLAAGDIVRSNLNDSVANPTELRTWLRNMNDIAADRMAISSYMQDGDSASAFALARRLPSLYDLQGDQLADHNDYMRLISLYQALRSSGRNIFQLTETETNMVRDMAENGMGVSQAMARSLMEQITGRSGDACLDLKLPGLRSGDKGGMTYSNTVESEKNGMNVSVGPNPATTWTTVNYTLPDNGTKALLTLTNSIGVNVLTMELEGAQGNKVLDLRSFAAGVYVYTVRYEQYTEIGKLVVTK